MLELTAAERLAPRLALDRRSSSKCCKETDRKNPADAGLLSCDRGTRWGSAAMWLISRVRQRYLRDLRRLTPPGDPALIEAGALKVVLLRGFGAKSRAVRDRLPLLSRLASSDCMQSGRNVEIITELLKSRVFSLSLRDHRNVGVDQVVLADGRRESPCLGVRALVAVGSRLAR